MGRSGPHVRSIRHPRPSDVVGILLGHNGTRHLLRHLRHCHGGLRIFRTYQRGTYSTHPLCPSLIRCFQEYILADVKNRQHLLTIHKKAKKLGLDLNQYNLLRDQISKVDLDLRKLRKKRGFHLPPKNESPGPMAAAALKADAPEPDAKKASESSAKECTKKWLDLVHYLLFRLKNWASAFVRILEQLFQHIGLVLRL